MVLDQECQRKVVKRLSQGEGKKEEKSYQLNDIDKLRKRSEFLDLRKNCITSHGKTIISNNDILTNTKLGIYSSKMIVHDIYNKNFSVKTFSYKDEFDKKVDIENLGGSKGHPLFPVNSILDEDNNKISDFSDANLTVQSTSADGNIFATSTYPNHRTPYGKTNPKEDILNRFSKIALLNNGVKHFLEVVGNTVLEVGQIITLKIPKNQTHEKFYDEKLSGNYMITELHHFFSEGGDRKHRIGMTIVKDSIKDGYPDALPKMPKGRGATKKL